MRAPLHPDLVGMIMAKLMLTYGRRFTNSYDADPDTVRAHWAHELAGLSEEGVRYALEHLPADYVPNCLQLRMLATSRPLESAPMLPAPQASPAVQSRALEAIRGLRNDFARAGMRLDMRWAEKILANPEGKSRYAVELATNVLRAHGRIQ